MKLTLSKKPKSPIMIQGFPGLGLVGTITSEYLIEHLKMEQIGSIILTEITPLVAIHEGKLVQPLGIYYDEKTNLLLVHVVANLRGIEWGLSEELVKLAKELDVKQVISLEGISSSVLSDKSIAFYFSTDAESAEKLSKVAEKLNEGVVVGVSAAMMIDGSIKNITTLFAETHISLPDSKGAAKLIEVLDKYLGLNIDPAPLLKQAEQFEEKIKNIIAQSQKTQEVQEAKEMSYLG